MTESSDAKAWPFGWQINPRDTSVSDELIEAFRDIPAPIIGDCLGRDIGSIGLRPYHGDDVLCGRALTVRVRPGDNLMVHKALLMAEPGDVIVIDGGGDVSRAVIGGLMRATAQAHQLAGFVIDGAIRDVAEWAEGGMPVFARGVSLRGPSKDGPGEINVPVAVGGLVVRPGDLVVGDLDGVVVASAERLPELHEACLAKLKSEAAIRETNAAGGRDIERFDRILRAKGLPV